MMIWCHLHKELSAKHGITNYDMKEYEAEYDWLMTISQEDLIESLRCDGRKQAATRQLRNKQHSTMCAGVTHLDGQKGEKKGVCPTPTSCSAVRDVRLRGWCTTPLSLLGAIVSRSCMPAASSSHCFACLQGNASTAARAPEGSELQAERKGAKVPAPAGV